MVSIRRMGVLVVTLALGLVGCQTGTTPEGTASPGATTDVNPSGKTVKIAFSAPGADHGWLAAITANAEKEARKYSDVDFVLLEGTNDVATQQDQIQTLISQDPDALVILPHEGDPLTRIARRAMQQGIPVINIDREFSSQAAYRLWIGGDNYGIGQSAGEFFATELDCKGNVVEIQGIAGISVTNLRTQGFAEAIKSRCGDGIKILAKQPADFVPDKGLTVMETLLQAHDDIDAVYTHDDDMAEGVVAAIRNAGREDEMWVTGAGGSKTAMERIEQGGLYKATFLYNPSMAASAISLARLIALDAGLSELAEPEVPSRIQLPASTVTKDNVGEFKHLGY